MHTTQVPHLDKHTVGRLYKLEPVIKLVIIQWAMILQMLWFKGVLLLPSWLLSVLLTGGRTLRSLML